MKRDRLGLGLQVAGARSRVSSGGGTVAALALGALIAGGTVAAAQTANGIGAVAQGSAGTTATGTGAVAIGNADTAAGDGTVAIGNGANSNFTDSIAVGTGSAANSQGSVAIGPGATSNGGAGPGSNIAIGRNATASSLVTSFSSVAIGYQASATSTGFGGSIALGYNAQANITAGIVGSPIAIGWNANATSRAGTGSQIAIGDRAVATGLNAIAIGGQPNSTGAAATGDRSIAIGQNVVVTGADASVFGSNASSSAAGGVALGQLSTQRRVGLSGASENFSGATVASTQGSVSVGSVVNNIQRQITNVAGGTQPTDAVNVRQLSAVGTNLAGSLGGGATFNPTTGVYTGPNFVLGGANYQTVGAALTALDNGTAGPFISNNVNGRAVPTVTGADGIAGGFGASATAPQSTALGNTAQAGLNNSVALGFGSTTAAASSIAGNPALGVTNNAGAVAAGSGNVVSVGAAGAERQIQNVSAGAVTAGSTDAVNGSQLFSVASNANAAGTGAAAGLGGGAAFNPATGTFTAPTYTLNNGATTVNNVGDALTNLDVRTAAAGNAVTGLSNGTLGVVQRNGANNTVAITAAGGTGANPGAAQRLTNVAAGALNANSTDAVNGSQLFATNQTVAGLAAGTAGPFASNNAAGRPVPVASGADATAGGFGAVASANRSTALGNLASATGQNSVALGAGSSDGGVANVVSVGAPGAERRISNVSAGLANTDAANVGQLNGLAARSVQYDANAAGDVNRQSITLNPGAGPVTIRNVSAGVAATDAVNVGQLTGATANAVQYTTQPNGTRSNTVALVGGDPTAPVRVSNVAAAVAPTDAVNLGQLNSAYNNLSQIGAYQFNSAKRQAYAGTAIALAAAGLRYDDRPGKVSLAIGASGYHGAGGVAIGLGGTSEDGSVRYHVAASFSPNESKASAGIFGGLSFTLNDR